MLKLHVLSCGHGDTLLLQMPRKKWALIDCHLPGKVARDRFFDLITKLGITTLDFIVLTHPDSDHYKGMADVLEYFSDGNRSVRYYCDSGGSHQHVIKLLESRGTPPEDITEYVRLIKTVLRLQQDDKLDRLWLHNQTATIRITGNKEGFSLVAVGPAVAAIAKAQDLALLNEVGFPDINELSVVLIAQLITRLIECRILLPGDMEGDGMAKALERWDSHLDNVGNVKTFDVVKAPHHGSINGHDVQLVDRIRHPRHSVVAISCGTSYDLPSRTAITDYLDREWRVYCTTPRHFRPKAQNALQLMHSATRAAQSRVEHNLIVSARPGVGARVRPPGAEIKRTHLAAYV